MPKKDKNISEIKLRIDVKIVYFKELEDSNGFATTGIKSLIALKIH